jgi:hypothetical protein
LTVSSGLLGMWQYVVLYMVIKSVREMLVPTCKMSQHHNSEDHRQHIQIFFIIYWRRNGTVHQLFIEYKKACDSVRREVMYSILIDFGIPVELDRLIKVC